VTDDGMMRIKFHGETAAELPIAPLVSNAPVYERPLQEPSTFSKLNQSDLNSIPLPKDFNSALEKLVGGPNLSSRRWIWEQYDHMVMLNTVVLPGSDAAVLRIPDSRKGVAVTTDCNAGYCYLNPRLGGQIAVAEAARNLVCSGAKPLAITDCLNFGSPEKPEVMWQFKEAVEGITEACIALNTPVTGGNVSFYNETKGEAIHPTPTIGMVGLLEDVEKRVTQFFKEEGDLVLLLGETQEELGGSEYLKFLHQRLAGPVPTLDLKKEKVLQELVLTSIQKGLVKSAHDCSEGGLAVALAECSITGASPIGVKCNGSSPKDRIRPDALLFGESQGRILLSVSPKNLAPVLDLAKRYNVTCSEIGKIGGERLVIGPWIDIEVKRLRKLWEEGFEKNVKGEK
jgi:phosphoribosylformylglycinamidine synthase